MKKFYLMATLKKKKLDLKLLKKIMLFFDKVVQNFVT